jgi:EmrB/QacA subfamily drug resistance transporter
MSNTVLPSRRPFVIASIMLATFMAAIEATIVATAMPHIVGQLGGFTYYSWVFSAFLLAQSTTTVIYGKLSDIFGRKPVLMLGMVLFLAGSLLCGLAWSMASLILFRLIQGLGAGAIQPVTMTVIGDLYKMEERGRAQGMMASVWATSAVVGPLVGGLIVDHASWAWIFWINIPIGLLALLGVLLFLRESVERRAVRIDYLGALLFSIATISLLLILTEAQAGGALLWALAACFVISAGLFLLQERVAPEPLISIQLWRQPLIATSNAATLLSGMVLIGLTTVLPLYVQGVMGRSPVVAGFTLTMLVLGWPLAVTLSGRFYRRFGIRPTLRAGSLLLPIGASFLLFLSPELHPVIAGAGSFLIGFGMGIISITSIALVQDSVEWSARGSATASIIFSRSLGNTLGATALGAILNVAIAHYGSREVGQHLHDVLNRPDGLAELASNPAIRGVFDSALHWTFWGVVAIAVLTIAAIWMIPISVRPADKKSPAAKPQQAAD